MNLIQEAEAFVAKLEGEAKAAFTSALTFLHSDKASLITQVEAEVAKGTPELQALWAKLKALL